MDQVERANEQSVYKQSIKKWRGGGGGKRKKKNRREDKNKKTNNEREQENQATCKRVALYEQKREGRKDSTHKVRGSRLKAKAEARKRKR